MDIGEMLYQRQNRYGEYPKHAELAQALKTACHRHDNGAKWATMSAYQREAMDMICHKMARVMNGDPNYLDNWVDLAGYANLVVNELEAPKDD